MQLAITQIHKLTREVWRSVLDMEINPDERELGEHREQMITGVVHITGVWDGAVLLDCSLVMARRAAGVIFECEPNDAQLEDLQDVLGELANMVGGNVKSLLPGPCSLSLPTVVEGGDYRLVVRESRPLCRAAFECDGEPVFVTVLERAASNRKP